MDATAAGIDADTVIPAKRPRYALAAASTAALLIQRHQVDAIVFTGVYPKPMLDRIEPSVQRLVEHVEAHSDWHAPVVEAEEGEG